MAITKEQAVAMAARLTAKQQASTSNKGIGTAYNHVPEITRVEITVSSLKAAPFTKDGDNVITFIGRDELNNLTVSFYGGQMPFATLMTSLLEREDYDTVEIIDKVVAKAESRKVPPIEVKPFTFTIELSEEEGGKRRIKSMEAIRGITSAPVDFKDFALKLDSAKKAIYTKAVKAGKTAEQAYAMATA